MRIRIARMNCTKRSFNFKLCPVKHGDVRVEHTKQREKVT